MGKPLLCEVRATGYYSAALTSTPLPHPGEIHQILSHVEPLPDHEVTVMQEYQALRVDRTNIFGFVFW